MNERRDGIERRAAWRQRAGRIKVFGRAVADRRISERRMRVNRERTIRAAFEARAQ